VEYFVAAANMYYYWTIVTDLPDEELVVLKPPKLKKPLSSSVMANGHKSSMNGDLPQQGKKDL
jgi:hypothetical protein